MIYMVVYYQGWINVKCSEHPGGIKIPVPEYLFDPYFQHETTECFVVFSSPVIPGHISNSASVNDDSEGERISLDFLCHKLNL